MIQYNMDFLIAGLIFLLILFVHFVRYKQLTGISGKLFWIFIVGAFISDGSIDPICVLWVDTNLEIL